MANINLHHISGFDYEVDREGNVWSLPRVVVRANGRPYTVPRKKLRPRFNGGHLQVVLYKDKKRHVRLVHHLVLEAFVGPRPDGMNGLHKDDDPYNNRVENLYWGTARENALDRVRNGRDANARKSACDRGHDLSGPNLAPWTPPPHRRCLACNRAATLANYRGIKDPDYVSRLADEKYLEIVGAVA